MNSRHPKPSHQGPDETRVEPAGVDPATATKVQCPNCCRLAPVVSRSMGLLFYHCELCHTTGAAPESANR
jgi:hypothetical protein